MGRARRQRFRREQDILIEPPPVIVVVAPPGTKLVLATAGNPMLASPPFQLYSMSPFARANWPDGGPYLTKKSSAECPTHDV